MSDKVFYEAVNSDVRLFCAINPSFAGALRDTAAKVEELENDETTDSVFEITSDYSDEGWVVNLYVID